MTTTKHCPKCRQDKPGACFSKNASKKDGLASYCKGCSLEYINKTSRSRAYKAHWQSTNPQKSKKWNDSWRSRNPDRHAAHVRAYQARKLGASGTYSSEDWERLCERFGNVCVNCGKSGKLTADHVIPLSKGGTNEISNIQPLCRSCNSKKHATIADYRW